MFTVRAATRSDVIAVDALLARAYPRLLKPDYAPSIIVMALPLISRAKPALVTCGTYFVVEHQGAIIGAGGWTLARPGANPGAQPANSRMQQGTGNIRHVVTDDRHVRHGVGTALMNHILTTAKAAGVRQLECLSTLTASPFYQAMGFTVRGPVLVPLAQAINFPAIAMWRDL